MVDDIYRFVASWLPSYVNDNRSYRCVAEWSDGAATGCRGSKWAVRDETTRSGAAPLP